MQPITLESFTQGGFTMRGGGYQPRPYPPPPTRSRSSISCAAWRKTTWRTYSRRSLLLAAVSGALLVALLAFRFFSHDGPRPGWLVAVSVVAFSLAIAIVWLLQQASL